MNIQVCATLACLLFGILPRPAAVAGTVADTLRPAPPQTDWRVQVQRSVERRDRITRQGHTTTYHVHHQARWLDQITQTRYGSVTRTRRTPIEMEIRVNGEPRIPEPAGDRLLAYREDRRWRLRDVGQSIVDDTNLLIALGGGPSLELWPTGPLQTGRHWCFSETELERRLAPLGIDYGSLTLTVKRIAREPATGLQTAHIEGELYAVLPHRGLNTQLRARVSVDLALALGLALRTDIEGRFSADRPDPETAGGRLSVDGHYLFRQTLAPSRSLLAALDAAPPPAATSLRPAKPKRTHDPRATAALHQAMKSGNHAYFNQLLRNGADPNSPGPSGCPLLHEVILGDATEKAWSRLPVLIKQGAEVDAVCPPHGTALLLAIDRGKPLAPIINGLLAAGADPDKASATGETPLMRAVKRGRGQTGLVRALLDAGASLEKRDRLGNSLLAHALRDADSDTLVLLLEAGADTHGPNRNGEPTLLLAAKRWDDSETPAASDKLSQSLDTALGETDHHDGRDVLGSIAYRRTLRLLLRKGADLRTALDAADPASRARQRLLAVGLREAVACGDAALTHDLLQQGADPLARWDDQGQCSLLDTALLSPGNETALVDTLLQAGAPLDRPCHDAGPPLSRAADKAPVEVLRTLLRHGADVDAPDGKGRTPLMQVLMRNDPRQETAAAQLMLAAGASVNHRDREGDSVLHRAALLAAPETIRLLLAHGARIEATDNQGRTPLMVALQRGRQAAADTLTAAGADLNHRDASGATVLHLAAEGGELDLVERLLQAGADVGARDRFHATPLILAAARGRVDVMDRLLRQGADANAVKWDHSSALIAVAELIDWQYENGNVALDILLSAGAWLDQQDDDGDTALMKMARRGHEEGATRLIEAGANIHLVNKKGETALLLAAERDDNPGQVVSAQRRILQRLLELGADPNARDGRGRTALGRIAREGSPLDDIHDVALLLRYGTDPSLVDRDGKTARALLSTLDLAAWKRLAADTAKPLVEAWLLDDFQAVRAGARPLRAERAAPLWQVDARDDAGRTRLMRAAQAGYPTSVQYFLERGAAVNATDPKGMTPTMLAAIAGRAAALERLLQAGGDPGMRQENGFAPIHLAAIGGEADSIETLLTYGVAVDQPDAEGHAALWHAVQQGHPGVARLLLDRGAAVNAADAKGWTALMAATIENAPVMARLLLERGADPEARTDQGISARLIAEHKGYDELLELYRSAP